MYDSSALKDLLKDDCALLRLSDEADVLGAAVAKPSAEDVS